MLFRFLIRLLKDARLSRRPGHAVAATSAAREPHYSTDVFHAGDLEKSKGIILQPVPGMSTQDRWELETDNLVKVLGELLNPGMDSVVLDYGCGIGRVAKALIDEYHCSVIGVDISSTMRQQAIQYVNSDRFSVYGPEEFSRKVRSEFRVTGAYACWVLQHCQAPQEDIALIRSALAPDAPFFVLNSDYRWVPTDQGWAADDISIRSLLAGTFEVISPVDVTSLVSSRLLAKQSYALLARNQFLRR